MSIDTSEIKRFWEKRAKNHNENPGLTNLEESEELRELKIQLEDKRVSEYMDLDKEAVLLDLGGGNGQWAFKFADKVKKIYVIDYSEELLRQGRRKAEEKNVNNVEFIHSALQEFEGKEVADVIFISGVLIYLNDGELDALMEKIKKYSKEGSIIVLRDGTGIKGRFEINKKFSEALQTFYSAIYRTREEYIALFN